MLFMSIISSLYVYLYSYLKHRGPPLTLGSLYSRRRSPARGAYSGSLRSVSLFSTPRGPYSRYQSSILKLKGHHLFPEVSIKGTLANLEDRTLIPRASS
jgi:hypothetical protein